MHVRSGSKPVIYVDDNKVVTLRKRIALMNRRCADLGVTGVRLEDQGTVMCRERAGAVVAGHRMLLRFPEVRLGSWRVIGRMHMVQSELASLCLGEDAADVAHVGESARLGLRCEHCQAKRRRSASYVLRHVNDGRVMTLGASCVALVTSASSAVLDVAAKFDALLQEFDIGLVPCDGSSQLGSGQPGGYLDLQAYLADVLFVWDQDGGFVSIVLAEATKLDPTYERAATLQALLAANEQWAQKYSATRNQYLDEAKDAIDWVAQRDSREPFERRLTHLARQDRHVYERRVLAQAAVIVVLHRKHVINLRRAKASSVHLGEVGQELELELSILKVVRLPDAGGLKWVLVLMNDQGGNQINWRTASASDEIMQGAGRSMSVRCQVKEHTHYRGVCQTVVSHLQVLRWLDGPCEV